MVTAIDIALCLSCVALLTTFLSVVRIHKKAKQKQKL